MGQSYPVADSAACYATGNRYRDATLTSMLEDVARRHPAREALVLCYARAIRGYVGAMLRDASDAAAAPPSRVATR